MPIGHLYVFFVEMSIQVFGPFLTGFFKKLINYLFIFGCVGSSLLHVGFLQSWRAGATLRCGARASHCRGFSRCGARALGARASVVVARGLSSCGSWALERKLSSCGARAQLLRGMWDLPGPGREPVSPALARRFLTTTLPGKSLLSQFESWKLQARAVTGAHTTGAGQTLLNQ